MIPPRAPHRSNRRQGNPAPAWPSRQARLRPRASACGAGAGGVFAKRLLQSGFPMVVKQVASPRGRRRDLRGLGASLRGGSGRRRREAISSLGSLRWTASPWRQATQAANPIPSQNHRFPSQNRHRPTDWTAAAPSVPAMPPALDASTARKCAEAADLRPGDRVLPPDRVKRCDAAAVRRRHAAARIATCLLPTHPNSNLPARPSTNPAPNEVSLERGFPERWRRLRLLPVVRRTTRANPQRLRLQIVEDSRLVESARNRPLAVLPALQTEPVTERRYRPKERGVARSHVPCRTPGRTGLRQAVPRDRPDWQDSTGLMNWS